MLLLLQALAGCSAIRLAYANGPQLAWWWLDGYMDFSREQTPAVRQAVDRWFDWHRASQLPDYAALLASAQQAVVEPATPAQACRWNALLRERADPALQRALADLTELIPALTEEQIRHLERRFAKVIDEMRDDFLQPDPAERQAAAVKRTLERAERLYGSLQEAQKRVLAAGVAASPFDPEQWQAERMRRQRDVVQTLRRLLAERADRDQRLAALRMLVDRSERSPDPTYRAYQQRLLDYNCAFAARLHNATTAAQRQQARSTLKGWEDDLRALMPAPAAGQ